MKTSNFGQLNNIQPSKNDSTKSGNRNSDVKFSNININMDQNQKSSILANKVKYIDGK